MAWVKLSECDDSEGASAALSALTGVVSIRYETKEKRLAFLDLLRQEVEKAKSLVGKTKNLLEGLKAGFVGTASELEGLLDEDAFLGVHILVTDRGGALFPLRLPSS